MAIAVDTMTVTSHAVLAWNGQLCRRHEPRRLCVVVLQQSVPSGAELTLVSHPTSGSDLDFSREVFQSFGEAVRVPVPPARRLRNQSCYLTARVWRPSLHLAISVTVQGALIWGSIILSLGQLRLPVVPANANNFGVKFIIPFGRWLGVEPDPYSFLDVFSEFLSVSAVV